VDLGFVFFEVLFRIRNPQHSKHQRFQGAYKRNEYVKEDIWQGVTDRKLIPYSYITVKKSKPQSVEHS